MSHSDASWGSLKGIGNTITGDGFVVRGRTQSRLDELWLNVRLPDGSWAYLVLNNGGEVVVNAHAALKRHAYTEALVARQAQQVGERLEG